MSVIVSNGVSLVKVSGCDDAVMTRIDPIILMWIEIKVAMWIGVLRRIRAKTRENSVLIEEITVTADNDVSTKLQLKRILDIRELMSINGQILEYCFQTATG